MTIFVGPSLTLRMTEAVQVRFAKTKCNTSRTILRSVFQVFKRLGARTSAKFRLGKVVPRAGLEPARPLFTKLRILNPVRLPISPPGHVEIENLRIYIISL
jgi:hypothetical protein